MLSIHSESNVSRTEKKLHQQAYQDLMRLQEPIPENKKVRDFLHEIMDPQCAAIKLTVLSNQIYMNYFLETVNYMASAIDLLQKNEMPNSRQIAQANTKASGRSVQANQMDLQEAIIKEVDIRIVAEGRGRTLRGCRGHVMEAFVIW